MPGCPAIALRLASAGGQDEQPWLWKSSTTTRCAGAGTRCAQPAPLMANSGKAPRRNFKNERIVMTMVLQPVRGAGRIISCMDTLILRHGVEKVTCICPGEG